MDPITSDTKLWEDFKNSEKYALTHIYYLYADPLFRYGKKFSSDNELVKDAIQDLFFDLIRTRDKLGPTDHIYFCLLYTSDAADEEDSVDLGGRRIIKKKKKQ